MNSQMEAGKNRRAQTLQGVRNCGRVGCPFFPVALHRYSSSWPCMYTSELACVYSAWTQYFVVNSRYFTQCEHSIVHQREWYPYRYYWPFDYIKTHQHKMNSNLIWAETSYYRAGKGRDHVNQLWLYWKSIVPKTFEFWIGTLRANNKFPFNKPNTSSRS